VSGKKEGEKTSCVLMAQQSARLITNPPIASVVVRGRLHIRIRVCIGKRFGVRFGANKGGLQSNLGSIYSEMCLQTVVMGV
jgi:hypothetical protein